MLAVWRLHGLDAILREAWQAGVVLCGLSAGSLCWFGSGTTDAFGRGIEPLHDGLGFLPWSHSPHYDSEPERRPKYQQWIASGVLSDGFAADDCAGLHFVGTELFTVVSSRDDAQGYRVTKTASGVEEAVLPTLLLG
jgi:peptidase E